MLTVADGWRAIADGIVDTADHLPATYTYKRGTSGDQLAQFPATYLQGRYHWELAYTLSLM